MFYTGVDTVGHQSLGLAWSLDLADWHRLDSPIFDCAKIQNWAWCDGENGWYDLRDPFVMADPNHAGRWLMYYATRMRDGHWFKTSPSESLWFDYNCVPGLAVSDGDFTQWTDAGPLWRWSYQPMRWWTHQGRFESPHVFEHDSTWYVTFSTDSNQELELTTSCVPSDTGSAWTNWCRVSNYDCSCMYGFYASEYLKASTGAGVGREYFASVAGDRIRVWDLVWHPDGHFILATPQDFLPPIAVGDVDVATGLTTAVVTWSAPGDEWNNVTTAEYDLRWSSSPITEENFWNAAGIATGAPNSYGTWECAQEAYFEPCSLYYFALRSRDSTGNWSALSNVASARMRCSGSMAVECLEGLMAQGWGESGWSQENSLLGQAGTDLLAGDTYRLSSALECADKRARLRLQQVGAAAWDLDAVSLGVVDHGAGGRAFASGDQVLVGTTGPVARVVDQSGTDVTNLLTAGADGLALRAGWSLDVSLGDKASSAALLVEIGGASAAADAATAGITVETPDALGQWQKVATLVPRQRPEMVAVESIRDGRARLTSTAEYVVRRLARLDVTEQVAPVMAGLAEATHSRLGSVIDAVRTADGRETVLGPSESIEASFGLPPQSANTVRDFFLTVRGKRAATGVQAAAHLVRDPETPLPTSFALHPGQPNPLAHTTRIRFDLPRATTVRLEILDAQGRRVRTLMNGWVEAGARSVEWDRRGSTGVPLGPGIYLCRLEADSFRAETKLVVIP